MTEDVISSHEHELDSMEAQESICNFSSIWMFLDYLSRHELSESSVSSVYHSLNLEQSILVAAIRDAKLRDGQNVNPVAFRLIRSLKSIEQFKDKELEEIDDRILTVIDVWMKTTGSSLNVETQNSFESEVVYLWDDVKKGADECAIEDAANYARQHPYSREGLRLTKNSAIVASMCQFLADKDDEFFLSCRDASRPLVNSKPCAPTGQRPLVLLARKGVIEELEKGRLFEKAVTEDGESKKKRVQLASRYRWIG